MPSFSSGWYTKHVPWIAVCLTLWGTLLLAADIGRGLDPVVLKGENFPGLLGKENIGLRLYAYNADEISWRAVPFQVDNVVKGSYYGQSTDDLDRQDELVFMARDLGDQTPERVWLDEAVAVQHPRYEIAVQNPLTGAMGYLYLYWSPFMAGNDQAYISYQNQAVYGETYVAGQNTSQAGGLLTDLTIPTRIGGDGIDLLDEQRLRLRTTASYTGVKTVTLEIREQWKKGYVLEDALVQKDVGVINVDVKHVGFKNIEGGPIRLIRTNYIEVHVDGKVDVLGFKTSFDERDTITVGYKFYPGFYEMPFDSIVIALKSLAENDRLTLKNSRILFCSVLNTNGLGMRYYNPRIQADLLQGGLKIDGTSDASKFDNAGILNKPEDWPGKHWWGMTADATAPASPVQHVTLFTIADLRGQQTLKTKRIRYSDNDIEDGPRVYGVNGIQLEQDSGLPSSIPLTLTLRQYLFPQVMNFNQMQALYDTYKTPLKVTATRQFYDIMPPGTISDLDLLDASRTDSSVTLTWTAVGDDCTAVRAATRYEIRYSEALPAGNRDWAWWDTAKLVEPLPIPGAPKSREQFTITGLKPESHYYFAVNVYDEANNFAPSIAMVTSSTTPVELAAFTAVSRTDQVDLAWKTASESNNLGFALERRMEKESGWLQVAFIAGHGTTSTAQSYSWVDSDLPPGVIHYRLKQVDTGGKANYFAPISVTVKAPTTWNLAQNFPNPFNPATAIVYQVPEGAAGGVSLTIYDLLGRHVRQLVQAEAKAGYHRIEWDGRDDQGLMSGSGVYIYILSGGEKQIVRKMIKLQ